MTTITTKKRRHANLTIPTHTEQTSLSATAGERATMDYLQELLHLLVRHCIEYMDTVPPERRRPAHLNVIRSLLKDNHVMLDAAHKVSPMRALQALDALTLPFGAKGH